MLKSISRWIRRAKPASDEQYHQRIPMLPPSNIEVFQLATLFALYEHTQYLSGTTVMTIREVMIHKMQAGAWHPEATLKESPLEYFLNAERDSWNLMVDENLHWFSREANTLKEMLIAASKPYQAEIDAIEKKKGDSTSDKRDKIQRGKLIIYDVARSLVDGITIKGTSDFNPVDGKELVSPACQVSVNFQGQEWVFDVMEGSIGDRRISGAFSATVDGKVFRVTDESAIYKNKSYMINVIAMHSARNWKKSILLSYLNSQPLFKRSAQLISAHTNACYHNHLLEVERYTLEDVLDEAVVRSFYVYKYNCGWQELSEIIKIYKNIFVEKELAGW